MAVEMTEQKGFFPAGICISNVGDISQLADEMRYFEIEKGMVTHN
ncbi:hypothetical protein [Microbulbifer okhotskensis]|nr:hypothetical protein [Microbulbifer okhotskensis]